MKKNIIKLLFSVIILTTAYISYSFFLYRDYFKKDKNSLFFYIPIILGTYSSESNNENNSFTKDDFYSFINSYYTDSLFISFYPTINFLNRHKEEIRFDFHPDSNYYVLYHIGIDGIDDSLKGKVFEKLPFYYPLYKPKGDILLGYFMPHNKCVIKNGLNWYFINSKRLPVSFMDSILNEKVLHSVSSSIEENFENLNSIQLLFKFHYDSIWESTVLCNWSNTSYELTYLLSEKIKESLTMNEFELYADSIILNFDLPKHKF